MSQMSKHSLKVTMSDKNTLMQALTMCSKQFQGLTATQVGKDIVVRYKGIEQYRSNGNLSFKWAGAKFEAVGDDYHTNGQLAQVLAQVEIMYRRAGAAAVSDNLGSTIKEAIPNGYRIRLTTRR